jgi:ubiquinone/menaquinone biosynthesis C-methylase UbiE
MMGPQRLEEARAWWRQAAEVDRDADGLSPCARDPYLQDCIEAAILPHIAPDHRVIDIGCGDGASSLKFAGRCASLLGVDYTEAYVRRARNAAQTQGVGNAEFLVGDAVNLVELHETRPPFDIAISIRCLINLGSTENQFRALREIAGCLKPGSLYLLSEGWQEGWDSLNAMRRELGLPEMSLVTHNLLLNRHDFEREASKYFKVIGFHSLGTYLMISRLLQPAFVAPEQPRHRHELNRFACEIAKLRRSKEFSDIDFAGVYVLRRV